MFDDISDLSSSFIAVLDSFDDIIHIIDENYTVKYINPAGIEEIKKIGINDNPVGKNLKDVFSFLPPKVWKEYETVFSEKKPIQTKENILVQEYNRVSITKKIPFFTKQSKKLIVTIIKNITENIEKSIQLEESEARYEKAFKIHPDSINLNKLDGTYVEINKGFTRLTGYTKEDVIGKLSSEIDIWAIPEDRKKLVKGLQEKGLVENMETKFRLKDGNVKAGLISATLINLNSENHILSITRDISDKQIVEQELIDSARKINGIYKIAPAGIGMVSNRIFTDVNESVCKMTGYTKEELIGSPSKMVYPTIEDYNKVGEDKYKQIAETGQGSVETRWVTKNGEIIDIILASTPLDANNIAKGVIFTAWDISIRKKQELELLKHKNNLEKLVFERTGELKDANNELEQINKELVSQNNIILKQKKELEQNLIELKETQSRLIESEKMASLGILTAGVAHEINNPLNYIMGAYVGLEDYFNEKGYAEKDNINILLDGLKVGIDRASGIVKGLNQFNRNNSELNEECDIISIIDHCLLMLHNQTKYHVKIVRNHPNDDLISLGNTGKLHQVFINVLTNAIQAINETGDIIINTNIDSGNIIIEIIDNGIGISQKNLEQITQPFFTTKDPGEGTGLGLSIAYNIIKDHKGKLEFSSKLGEGTTVRIFLPRHIK